MNKPNNLVIINVQDNNVIANKVTCTINTVPSYFKKDGWKVDIMLGMVPHWL
jgi:hypothetical protein